MWPTIFCEKRSQSIIVYLVDIKHTCLLALVVANLLNSSILADGQTHGFNSQ